MCAQIKEVIPGMHPNLDSNTATRATGSGVGGNPAPHLAGNRGTLPGQNTVGGLGGEGYAQGAGGMSTEASLSHSACLNSPVGLVLCTLVLLPGFGAIQPQPSAVVYVYVQVCRHAPADSSARMQMQGPLCLHANASQTTLRTGNALLR